MKIVVTGGAGFIGSHIVDALLARGHRVSVIDNLSSGRRENLPDSVDLLVADIGSDEAQAMLREGAFEVVVHEAAQIDVRRSVADPGADAQVNVADMVRALEAARQGGTLQHVLFASSGGAIYGEQDSFPAGETHAIQPESPYGVAKRCGELYLAWFARAYDIGYTALRYANVYGPRQDPHGEAGVVAIFASRLLDGETPVIYGDGGQTRDFVYVGDVVAANLAALDKRAVGAFNVGTGVETSVNQIFALLAREAGFAGEARYEAERPGEQRRSVIDASLARHELGFAPAVSLSDGMARTFAFFKDRHAGGADAG